MFLNYNGHTERKLSYRKPDYYVCSPQSYYDNKVNYGEEKLTVSEKEFDLWWESSPEEIAAIEDNYVVRDEDGELCFDEDGDLIYRLEED